jgi:hypothetical protein
MTIFMVDISTVSSRIAQIKPQHVYNRHLGTLGTRPILVAQWAFLFSSARYIEIREIHSKDL